MAPCSAGSPAIWAVMSHCTARAERNTFASCATSICLASEYALSGVYTQPAVVAAAATRNANVRKRGAGMSRVPMVHQHGAKSCRVILLSEPSAQIEQQYFRLLQLSR